MKPLKIVKNIIIGILVVVFFAFATTMTILLLNFNKYGVTQINKTSVVLMRDDISSKNFKKGDLVLVEGKSLENIKVGDEIFAYKVDKSGAVSIDLGIVDKVYTKEQAISFKNGSTYAMEFIIGKATKSYSNLGTYLSIIESKWGFLFLILVPSFLILIYELYALIVEIKYGKEESPSKA